MRWCEPDRDWKCQKRAATCEAYRVANQQRMATRRALEWIRTSKAQLVFKYEISDLCGHWHCSLWLSLTACNVTRQLWWSIISPPTSILEMRKYKLVDAIRVCWSIHKVRVNMRHYSESEFALPVDIPVDIRVKLPGVGLALVKL